MKEFKKRNNKRLSKIAAKLSDLLMKNEEIGYIAVQKNRL
jgi:hypothetical protein